MLTIVMVVFNGSRTICSALDSIRRQRFRNFEVLVIDGGSTDGTIDILAAEPLINHWVSEPDRGIYDAMNKAVGLAKGRWIYFLGSDDLLCECLEDVAERLRDESTIYYGDVYRTGSRRRYGGRFGPWRLLHKNICQQAMFYPRAVFRKYRYNLLYPILGDWELNLRCYADPELRFEYIPLTIAHYNDVSGVSSTARDVQFADDQPCLIRACLPRWCYLGYRATHSVRIAMETLLGK